MRAGRPARASRPVPAGIVMAMTIQSCVWTCRTRRRLEAASGARHHGRATSLLHARTGRSIGTDGVAAGLRGGVQSQPCPRLGRAGTPPASARRSGVRIDGGWDAMNVMKKMRWSTTVLAAVLIAPAVVVRADVKTTEKTQVEFGGMLGRVVNMFGGKAAREGVETSVAIKGDRKMSRTGETGQIIDFGPAEDLQHRLPPQELQGDDLRRAAPADGGGAEAGREERGQGGEPGQVREGVPGRLRREEDRAAQDDERLRMRGGRRHGHGAREGEDARRRRRHGPDR